MKRAPALDHLFAYSHLEERAALLCWLMFVSNRFRHAEETACYFSANGPPTWQRDTLVRLMRRLLILREHWTVESGRQS